MLKFLFLCLNLVALLFLLGCQSHINTKNVSVSHVQWDYYKNNSNETLCSASMDIALKGFDKNKLFLDQKLRFEINKRGLTEKYCRKIELASFDNDHLCMNITRGFYFEEEVRLRRLNCSSKKDYIVEKKKKSNTEKNHLYRVGSGTGFAVSEFGHLITNNHVIDECEKVKIHSPYKILTAKIISRDKKNDLALLKSNFKPTFVFPIAEKPAKLMDQIYVAGFPFGYKLSNNIKATNGIISSLSGIGNDFSRIQIDAALQPGNSGGPIFNKLGNVVGVAVAKLDYKYSLKKLNTIPELINFGIKSSMIKAFLFSANVKVRPEVTKGIGDLGQKIQEGTFYISCLMTKSKYNSLKLKKVLFNEKDIFIEN